MESLEIGFGDLSKKMDMVLTALMGNDLTRDGGLVGRIIELEKEKEILKARVEILEKDKTKTDLQVKIMWGLGGSTLAAIIGYVLSLINK